jgi:hypothetical protein
MAKPFLGLSIFAGLQVESVTFRNCAARQCPFGGGDQPGGRPVGACARYDLNDHFHLLGYLGRGIENAQTTIA